MKLTLHLGAHRTGTSTLQRYMKQQCGLLEAQDVVVWTPAQTRDGRLTGLLGDPGRGSARRDDLARRSGNRVRIAQTLLAGQGVAHLVVSDENVLGSLRENIGLAALYPTAARRVSRLKTGLPAVDHVAVCVRSYDAYWTSAIGLQLTRGMPVPDRRHLDHLVTQSRRWRQVIAEVATTFAGARITVWSHERLAALPEISAGLLTGCRLPPADPGLHLNATLRIDALRARLAVSGADGSVLRADHGRFAPFDDTQRRTLRAQYAEDIAWLRAGADGLATFYDRPALTWTAHTLQTEGNHHDRPHRPLGRVGAEGTAWQTAG
jgi:hypothetical protein